MNKNNKNTNMHSSRTDERRINSILVGRADQELRQLPANTVDCVVTSPPYFRLRNYDHDQQIGLETHVDEWVDQLLEVFTQLERVLKQSGSVWLNLGDSYSRDQRAGAMPKSLLLGPERLLLKLSKRGWIVRNKVIWAKTNPMPNSVSDRLSCTHEYVYYLTRSPSYFFDLDAIRIPHRSAPNPGRSAKEQSNNEQHDPQHQPRQRPTTNAPSWAGPLAGNHSGLAKNKASGQVGHPLGKNPGDVWSISTSGFRGAHFATFPTALVDRPLLATCPERTCKACGLPWKRSTISSLGHLAVRSKLNPTCHCNSDWQPGIVLDPFFGAGTVGLAAEAHGRNWIGVEVSPKFAELAQQRISAARPSTPTDNKSERRAA